MAEEFKCEHCGGVTADEWELEIFHRGCRLRAAFPECCTTTEDGLMILDFSKLKDKLDEVLNGPDAASPPSPRPASDE